MNGKLSLIVFPLVCCLVFFGCQTGHFYSRMDDCSPSIKTEMMRRTECLAGDGFCWMSRRGYCTDYIEMRTGRRQTGYPNEWKSNIEISDVKTGDVAIFKSQNHVAYVEKILTAPAGGKASLRISEYNYGACWVDRDNIVTSRYGILSERTVAVSDVDGGFWRPR